MRVTVSRESEWTREQVALLLAARAYEGDLGTHGQPITEATDPQADPGRRDVGWHYEAEYRVDHAARALTVAQDAMRKAYPDADPGAYLWTVEKVWETS